MSDIPSNILYIQNEETDFNSPVSEATQQKIGATINGLIDLTGSSKVAYYAGAGTTPIASNFIMPTEANLLYFYILGGGGGGGGTDDNLTFQNPISYYRGGAGGCGAYHVEGWKPIAGGTNLTVSVGGGGTGGPGNTNGGTGDNTTIVGTGINITARGNGGGERALDFGNNSFNQYQIGTPGGDGNISPTAGFGSQSYTGGQPGTTTSSGSTFFVAGGGGGSSPLAQGGRGGDGELNGSVGVLGSGGGGAGGHNGAGFRNGGAGGAGLAILLAYKLG